jgi:hypothetical protein
MASAGLLPVIGHAMLDDSEFAVFVGRECCIQVAKVLKALSISPVSPPYAADQDYYAAVLRYKLS